MRPIKPIVIIINGAGGVGKDSVCDVIANNYITFVFDPLKNAHIVRGKVRVVDPSFRF